MENKNYKRPWWDSNQQSLPPYADVLSIKPQAICPICLQTLFLNNTATRTHYTNYNKCHIIEQYIQFVYYLPVDSAVH